MPLRTAAELLVQLQERVELDAQEVRSLRDGVQDAENRIWRVAARQAVLALPVAEPLQEAPAKAALQALHAETNVKTALEALFALRDLRPEIARLLRDVAILCVYAEVGHRSRSAFEQASTRTLRQPWEWTLWRSSTRATSTSPRTCLLRSPPP